MPITFCEGALPLPGQECSENSHAICPVEAVDGAPIFTDECRRGVSGILKRAAAWYSWRLKTQKLAGDLIVFDRLAAFKVGGAEVDQKYMATSGHP